MASMRKCNVYARSKSLEEKINIFASPLKEHGINFFTYSRIYKTNKFLFLCNSDDWYKVKLDNDLSDFNGFVCTDELNKEGFTKYIVSGEPKSTVRLLPHMYSMGLWNSVDYYSLTDDYIEITHFGGALHNPQIINFYLNQSLFLENLIYLFRHEFVDILEPPDPNLLVPLNDSIPELIPSEDFYPSYFNSNTHKFPLIFNGYNYLLSKRQAQCLGLALHGRTAKEIARTLGLSYRTVEDYIYALKIKLGCNTLSSLFSSLSSAQITNLLYFTDHKKQTFKIKESMEFH